MQEIVNTVPLFATLALVVNAFTVRLSITSTLKMYVYLFGNVSSIGDLRRTIEMVRNVLYVTSVPTFLAISLMCTVNKEYIFYAVSVSFFMAIFFRLGVYAFMDRRRSWLVPRIAKIYEEI